MLQYAKQQAVCLMLLTRCIHPPVHPTQRFRFLRLCGRSWTLKNHNSQLKTKKKIKASPKRQKTETRKQSLVNRDSWSVGTLYSFQLLASHYKWTESDNCSVSKLNPTCGSRNVFRLAAVPEFCGTIYWWLTSGIKTCSYKRFAHWCSIKATNVCKTVAPSQG